MGRPDQKALWMLYEWLMHRPSRRKMYAKGAFKVLRSRVVLLGWVLIALRLVSNTAGFSHGASPAACVTMKPKHISAQPQDSSSSYITVYTNKSSYLPGDKVPVTVRSTRDFMGFLIQARRVADDRIAGTFILISPGSKLLRCFEEGDTVTHSDKTLKRNLSFVWKAPDRPAGDIKFFVSAVQSYFIYWARIKSSIIFDQTQSNPVSELKELKKMALASQRNSTAQNLPLTEASTLLPLTVADHPAITQTGELSGDVLYTQFISTDQFLKPLTSKAEHEVPVRIEDHSAVNKQASSLLDQDTELLEPSLKSIDREHLVQPMENTILLKTTEFRTMHSEDVLLSHSDSLSCASCSDILQVHPWNIPTFANPGASEAVSLPVTTGRGYPVFWNTYFSAVGKTQLSPVVTRDAKRSAATSLLSSGQFPDLENMHPTQADNQLVSYRASANFLHLAESSGSSTGVGKVVRNTSLGMTRPIQKGDSGKGGSNPTKGAELGIPQLGILLGCSAALGMALAVGLRQLLSQHCHKRTEVSFRDPDSNIISVAENGELVHVRKIRENSFVLVQAEYNVITPSSTIGK
ncbi:reelin domain-containing protein 1-like [Callorhinchus milii]|uniref:reelin domain-containing protein 1-like n=1 Tax=Callorhinchus milii TaxID=7868 RepID=UPI001C3F7837|nr:reelin domain-containing protein 1-like [Callorhinchus milii]